MSPIEEEPSASIPELVPMERIKRETITFRRSFTIGGESFPAGAYDVETTEQMIGTLSFTGWQRTNTQISPLSGTSGRRQVTEIDPADLEAAIAGDTAL